ncbi:MAG: putative Ig domain-containing protein, partial [Verrucomicrobiales bacterium]
ASISPSSGVFSWTPSESQGPGNFNVTINVADDASPSLSDQDTVMITVSEVNLSPRMSNIDSQSIQEGSTLQLTASATDPDEPVQTLTYSLGNGAPSGASIDPSSGNFSWTPAAEQGPGDYSVAIGVTDDGAPAHTDTKSFNVSVTAIPEVAPALGDIGSKSIDEGSTLTFTAIATDADPGQSLTYSLDDAAPSGAEIDATTGVFAWTPNEFQGPGKFNVTVRVTDDGNPPQSDAETISITINEVNSPPSLSGIASQSIEEGATLQLTANATDSDSPAQTLTYSLGDSAPTGASIDFSSGAFSWTPSGEQVPGDYTVSIVVTDDGVPALSDTKSFAIAVSAIPEVAPVLGAIGAKITDEGCALAFTASATDADQGQTLAYSLDEGAPEGATIDVSTGVFNWTPTESQGPGTFDVIVRVTDDGNPPQSDAETVSVTVSEVNTSPTLTAIADQAIDMGSTLQLSVTASDRDEPAQTLAFSLGEGEPAGATIAPSSGVFNWSPTEEQTPGDYVARIVVTDDGDPALSDSQAIAIVVSAISDSAPVLAGIGSKTIAEGLALTFTASATDAAQGQTLSYSLDEDVPSGAGIEPSTGVVSWTPTEAQGPGTFNLTIRVTDDGAPPQSDAESIIVTVTETNASPLLADIGAKSIEEGSVLEFVVGAMDADEPAQSLTFILGDRSPAGASISSEGAFSWTPTEEQGPGQFDVTVQVTDPGTPALIDSETFSITVSEANALPVIAAIEDQSIIAGETLTVHVMADDSDIPTQNLSYRLVGTVPENASIDAATGVMTWPVPELFEQETQNLTVEVTDDGTPAQSAILQFLIGVSSIPAESAILTVTSVSFTDQDTLTIHWDSESGKRYRLEFSDSLLPDQWASIGEIVADGLTASMADTPGDLVRDRFYRIVRLD